ncbi:hypothetical protein LAZ67_14000659 [Cordylochernes scorpioides]|uniref:Transposase n=1 Tax=Cordylochernes scorpioides TaxID=51811 RepID=A0ABY6L9Q9_9ARAC|nr:hypothetical protein LAZ67_14000659 [Cordylochernes scorpioides]
MLQWPPILAKLQPHQRVQVTNRGSGTFVLKEDKKQESSKMETNEICAVIKYLCKKGMSPKEILKKWVAAFKLGRISTEDEHRPGRPVESVTQENIDKIHDLVMLDRRMTVCQIEVDRIMREHLGLRKLSARWVPKHLTLDQKAVRRKLSSDYLALFEANPEEFVNRFVTMDETWAHHFTPESKQQSMQWRHSGSPPPQKSQDSSISREGYGVCLLGFLGCPGRLFTIKTMLRVIGRCKPWLLFMILALKPLPHAPYSPDLSPSDFHLFPHLKKSLSGIHFRSDEEVIDAVTSFFELLGTSFFLEGIKALEHRWKKCIDLKGDYVEG